MVPESVSVDASQTYQLKVYGRTAAGDSVGSDVHAVAWSTSDPAIAPSPLAAWYRASSKDPFQWIEKKELKKMGRFIQWRWPPRILP